VRIDRLKANRGYVLIAIFIVAAILTPPDALSQCIMALPMYLLYESGVLMAQVMQRMQRAERERNTAKV
jgi:sec-independent protein translocase protein TatC